MLSESRTWVCACSTHGPSAWGDLAPEAELPFKASPGTRRTKEARAGSCCGNAELSSALTKAKAWQEHNSPHPALVLGGTGMPVDRFWPKERKRKKKKLEGFMLIWFPFWTLLTLCLSLGLWAAKMALGSSWVERHGESLVVCFSPPLPTLMWLNGATASSAWHLQGNEPHPPPSFLLACWSCSRTN